MKFYNVLYIVLFYSLSVYSEPVRPAAVTYEFSLGRFGDNVMSYLHAKWISFQYKIPILYRPFKYSDQLVLHYKEMDLITFSRKKAGLQHKILSHNDMTIDPKKRFIYVVPYFSEFFYERVMNKQWIYFEVDWNDEGFRQEIQRMIYPINESILNVTLPKDHVCVALHVRRGGGWDKPESLWIDPIKFPPDSFYIDQLKKISEIFEHKKIYAFVFTDDKNPGAIVDCFKKGLLGYDNITFNWRKEGNYHDANVIEDFFAMTKFDCLIHPQSNYSMIASKLTQYKVQIFPISYHINCEKDEVIIDKVEIVLK